MTLNSKQLPTKDTVHQTVLSKKFRKIRKGTVFFSIHGPRGNTISSYLLSLFYAGPTHALSLDSYNISERKVLLSHVYIKK